MTNNKYKQMNKDKQELGIYIHIPFCVRKCAYCDFLSAPATPETMKCYVDALIKEMQAYRKQFAHHIVTTIFIGGGTPSILEPELMELLLSQIPVNFTLAKTLEYTMECNPGTLTREKVTVLKQNEINRISLGLQSTVNEELKKLGRIHTYEEFLSTFIMLRDEGFANINIDLMSGLPGQTLQSWRNTLQSILNCQPEHISAYGLIIEEGTEFYHRELNLPTEEVEREMYHVTRELLHQSGYVQYEISNYAKPGYECNHNTSYWIRKNYLGLGLGASSLIENVRFHNSTDLSYYCSHSDSLTDIQEESVILTKNDQMEEYMFLGLRLLEGISMQAFEETFQISYEKLYGDITRELIQKNLLCQEGNRIFLSQKGLDLSNYVMAQFLF